MYTHRIISIKDREGIEKIDTYNELKSIHPNMSGEILYRELMQPGYHLCFVWDDDTGKMMRTSTIESYNDDDNTVEVVTRNSIYLFENITGVIEK